MQGPVYHVLLEGQKVGPYDRRTIVGMRIKNALNSAHMLIASDGKQLTVAELVQARPRESFQPTRSGSFSLVQATYVASLLAIRGPGTSIPAFQGEVEARVQTGVLRIAGRFRAGLGWREDRVKLPLKDVVHARVRSTIVDLWLRHAGTTALQRITLELFTPESAGEFVDWLPNATPWPEQPSQPATLPPEGRSSPWLWVAIVGTALAVGMVLVVVVTRAV